jgi:hypothetical protein
MKYIVFEHQHLESFVVFPEYIPHDDFAINLRGYKPVRAGFVELSNGKVYCYGESVSLKLKSGQNDSSLLNRQLGNQD